MRHVGDLPLGKLDFMGSVYVLLSHFWVQGDTTNPGLFSGTPPPPYDTCQGNERMQGQGRPCYDMPGGLALEGGGETSLRGLGNVSVTSWVTLVRT